MKFKSKAFENLESLRKGVHVNNQVFSDIFEPISQNSVCVTEELPFLMRLFYMEKPDKWIQKQYEVI